MSEPKVFMVTLRQPRRLSGEKADKRSDPFWEFASFGITGCHHLLMNPKKAERLLNARLAFAQGGEDGWRLVFLSPPVRIVNHGFRCCEARWDSGGRPEWPFRYAEAPLLMDRNGDSEISGLRRLIKDADVHSWLLKFAVKFRSRTRLLEPEIADRLIATYEGRRRSAKPEQIATRYEEAIADGLVLDSDQKATYEKFASKWEPCNNGSGRIRCNTERRVNC